MLRSIFSRLNGHPTHPHFSQEELLIIAGYLAAQDSVRANMNELKAMYNWMEAEMEVSNRLWCNLHRLCETRYSFLMERIAAGSIYHGYFTDTGSFRSTCTFDPESAHAVRYAEETPVDVSSLTDINEPKYSSTDSITGQEYCAFRAYTCCQKIMEKLQHLMKLVEEPQALAMAKVHQCSVIAEGEDVSTAGLMKWLTILRYLEEPFDINPAAMLEKNDPRILAFLEV